MFKKAKRCNFRRRNDSEDEEKAEDQQSGGPGAEDSTKPSESTTTTTTGPAPAAYTLNNHGNGFKPGAVKFNKEKKRKNENREEQKASLLSFQDDEGAY